MTRDAPHLSRERPTVGVHAALVVVAAAFLTYLFTDSRIDENLRAVGVLLLLLIAVFPRHVGTRWPAWAGVCGVMLGGIGLRPLDVPNHHYMLTYIGAAVTLSLTGRRQDQEALLRANARWLIVALMSLATLQRLLSPAFLDGSYIGFELTRGGFLGPVLPWLGDTASIASENDAAIHAFREQPPAQADKITLTPLTPAPQFVAYGFASMILAIEAWVALVMWRFPNRPIAHLSVWVFVASLSVIRQEMTFITVLCALGLLACPPTLPRLRLGYVIFACVAAASVLKTLNAGAG